MARDAHLPQSGAELRRLNELRRGDRGVVARGGVDDHEAHGVSAEELERRLLEMGFVEGARLAVLFEGLIRRDPMAVRVDDLRVALRRREAQAVVVALDDDSRSRGR